LHFTPGRDVLRLVERLEKARPLSGIAVLLEILNRLSLDRSVRHYPNEVLLSKHYLRCSTDDRIERIHTYLMKHYQEKVSSSEVAALVEMSTASFSRFFRHRTRKTFTQVLTEIRMMRAQRLLLESDKHVCEIARECGFRNMSHFNRVFKEWNGMRPGRFREV
jgi:transcriptional regulator GlxA family with amidase domain